VASYLVFLATFLSIRYEATPRNPRGNNQYLNRHFWHVNQGEAELMRRNLPPVRSEQH
jgi:hypothetical protein